MPVSKYSVDIDADANTSHAIMLRLIGGSKRVLDVGCAAGDLARALVDRGCEVSGVEVDAEAAEVARPALKDLVVGDLASLDLAAELGVGRFDVVVFGDVLEHLMDPLRVLRQARDLLAPGGYVVISVPNIAHAAVRLALLTGEFRYRPLGLLDETHVRFFTRTSLYALLSDAGLAPADVRRTVADPFGTEIQLRPEDVPPGLLDQLDLDPDAQTYQFVLTAVPDDASATSARLRSQFEHAEGEVDRLKREVERLESERAQLDQAAAHVEALTAETDRLRRLVEVKEALAAEQDRTVVALEAQVAELAAAMRRQVRELNDVRQQLQSTDIARQGAEERVAAMLGSTAWRLSAPVRALGPVRTALQGPVQSRRSLRSLSDARGLGQRLRLRERGVAGTLQAARSAMAAPAEQSDYQRWVEEHDTLRPEDRAAIRRHLDVLPRRPLLSVIVPTYNTDDPALREALDSVLAQIYDEWELCVVDDASPESSVWATLTEYAARDRRVKIQRRETNGGIAASTNDAFAMAAGEYVVLLDHDDVLPPHTLYMVALEVLAHPDADLIYSDEDKLDGQGRRYGPYFKSDFNPELLLGQNMISHLGVYRTSLVRELGGLRTGYEGSQDHDLALRVVSSSAPERIRHIPYVLYHWRQYSGSGTFSSANPDKAALASRRAVADHLERLGERAEVVPAPAFRTWNRVIWPVPSPAPEVTVVVPTRDRGDLLRTCVRGLLEETDYEALRVVVVDNDSTDRGTLQYLDALSADPRVDVLRAPGPFNYSALNNAAVRHSDSPLILLLNNDVVVRESGWLREMVSLASRPGIGAVGAKLLFENGLVQHGGVVLGILGVANHAHKFVSDSQPGYSGRLGLVQEFSAVTAACMLTPRSAYLEVGGLDEEHLPVAYNDIDYCLKLRDAGYRVLWTPHASLLHLESMSRGGEESPEQVRRFEAETAYLQRRWGSALRNDPAYNPNLSDRFTDFSLADHPRLQRPWTSYLA